MTSIGAVLDVEIVHRAGPAIEDPRHVLAWTCADGAWLEGGRNGFDFEVCVAHEDPDECGEACEAETSTFRATVQSATLEEDR